MDECRRRDRPQWIERLAGQLGPSNDPDQCGDEQPVDTGTGTMYVRNSPIASRTATGRAPRD
jgi:hypothetical protein